ncbi:MULTISPECIES: ABC-F family ATP-binding cassette domain-containing protein [Variovorax]|jgi:ATP-binding cassette, subfamily F, member 3|uniref:ABC-F family ATP-binding cassette domain-containing protein n=1 Tax=Variovorax TaxID=34072 RepID=UPI00086A90B6|nr:MULTISPECIES: ATP-binding cassette domain-containing protein [Variovorax]MBN8752065.1 ATP-binding cassette domain-containing protein [Variovorax sp.]ODU15490.1 MAG: ABC transporter [Variovorax sp. SCN 67-85]ODV17149.1 MAG: ABC transporter [Variovorax sp. SCN 67-20]OJZ09119.1 MAG: ABC transporter [Variovorax sp. 67-131]UKI11593.1 ATP-binding cassette domain-containing protein [Variovorax paradoxus]
MITLKNVILRRSAKVLLDGATVTLNPGEKVGLVGRNGAGKSTLFALLNGTLHEDGGDFYVPKQWRMAQVAQNMPETDESATEFVVGGDTRLTELREALAAIEAAYAENPDDADIGMQLAHAYTDLADAGEHDAVPRAQALILGLGFKAHEVDEPVNSFSGGWRMRLQLARALMCPSDLLLLDEPTNHLDLDALVWLEAWLQKYAGTMIVISHDREFLDAVTDVTLHIANAQLTRYGGNYSKFEDMRALQMEQQQQAFTKQQDKIAHLQKFIDRFKAKASKAKQAQSRVKALERMERVAPLLAEADFTFEFKEPGSIPNPMLSISNASFGYKNPEGGENEEPKTILRGVNRSVLAGQRIGILGANGQGKSTLVKTIAREMGALAGQVTEGKGLNIGYFAQQELDVLRPQDTPLEHMVRMARELGSNAKEATGEQALRGFLGSFNFSGDMVKQPVGTMSGGEKARLVLAMMVWQRPNLLLLDEPTNHLDLATREALAVALNEFEGTLMLVSHDRALLRSVCDEFWLVGRGVVGDFDGDLDDYQRYLLDEAKRLREEAKVATREAVTAAAAAAAPVAAPAAPQQRKQDAQERQQRSDQAKPIKREIAQIDERLAAAGTERTALEARMSQPLPSAEIAEAGKRLKALNDEIGRLEERWLALSDQLEALAA